MSRSFKNGVKVASGFPVMSSNVQCTEEIATSELGCFTRPEKLCLCTCRLQGERIITLSFDDNKDKHVVFENSDT